MLLKDYVFVLKNHWSKRIGKEKMCSILYDFVIENAEVNEDEEKPASIGKDSISRTLSGKYPVHQFIRNHIFDDNVNDQLIRCFATRIVPNLKADSEDIFFQIIQKIECDNISPSHKASLKRLANKDTISAFLADSFVYAVYSNSENETRPIKEEIKNIENQPHLVIKGIANGKKTDEPVVVPFKDLIGYSREDIINHITELIDKASELHVAPYNAEEKTAGNLFGLNFKLPRGNPYTFEKSKKSLIAEFCKHFDCSLPSDFFELGDLHQSLFPSMGNYGQMTYSLEGSSEGKKKLSMLEGIYDAIIDGFEKAPFTKEFSKLYYVALMVENGGTGYDEDVRVTLRFPPDTVVCDIDIMAMDKDAVEFFVNEAKNLIRIERGEDFLGYEAVDHYPPTRIKSVGFGEEPEVTSEDVKDLLMYYYVSGEEYDSVEITIKSINQHTSVAFPNIILLKCNSFFEIKYIIRSKKMPDMIEGSVAVRVIDNDNDGQN